MYCTKCGAQFSDASHFCPGCGAEVIASSEGEDTTLGENTLATASTAPMQGMKWFKFVIYVQLFLAALVALSTASMLATGAPYMAQSSPEAVYSLFPELRLIDICFAFLYGVLAIAAIVVRFRLAGYKRNAWKAYLVYIAAAACVALGYAISTSVIIGESTLDANTLISIIGNIVLIIVNFVYFRKRDHLFVN